MWLIPLCHRPRCPKYIYPIIALSDLSLYDHEHCHCSLSQSFIDCPVGMGDMTLCTVHRRNVSTSRVLAMLFPTRELSLNVYIFRTDYESNRSWIFRAVILQIQLPRKVTWLTQQDCLPPSHNVMWEQQWVAVMQHKLVCKPSQMKSGTTKHGTTINA